MLAGIIDRDSEFSGLRPFNPLRDIRPVTELIELSFAQDLDPSSRQMLNEMRTLAWLLGPLFWLLNRIDSPLTDILGGYVWVEEGTIIGNVTVHRRYKGRKGWFISNLAVHPHHRRKGIAHRLTMEGIQLAKSRAAQRVSLEVRANNARAQKLYEKLGFAKVDSVSRMKLERVSSVDLVPSGEYEIRTARADEWRKVYQLTQDTLSPGAREITPVKEEDHRLNFAQRLVSSIGNLLKGRMVHRWAAVRDDRFVGLIAVHTGGLLLPHSLTMMVHPDYRGKVEETLLAKALLTLGTYPPRPLSATIQPSYEEIVDLFRRCGFVEQETLDLLTLPLRHE